MDHHINPLDDRVECHNLETMASLLNKLCTVQEDIQCLTVQLANGVAEALDYLQSMQHSADEGWDGEVTTDCVLIDEHLNAKKTVMPESFEQLLKLRARPKRFINHLEELWSEARTKGRRDSTDLTRLKSTIVQVASISLSEKEATMAESLASAGAQVA
uniref:SKA2 domain-containing protein n=1 Tax=Macrostomum lignano TaxID=282301 RepID=A0A1I8GF20_9PLAT